MNKLHLIGALCAAVFSVFALPTQAALVSVLGGAAVYDTDRDISWVSNMNLAASNTFGLAYDTDLGDYPGDPYGPSYTEQILTDGQITWGAALHWIDAMNTASYLGFNDWRLPTSLNQDGSGPCPDYNCTDSEMGHLFYNEFGVTAGSSVTTGTATELAKFTNIRSSNYWSSTEYAPDTNEAWAFFLGDGHQDGETKLNDFYALAVHSGNVGAVPIPAAVWLFGSGLVGLLGLARRKKA